MPVLKYILICELIQKEESENTTWQSVQVFWLDLAAAKAKRAAESFILIRGDFKIQMSGKTLSP